MNRPQHALEPPQTLAGIARYAGPGLIVAGSIVGSGELIATTKTGAEAGFTLLWLILLGCVVKVFAQIELGRYALISGKTTLAALDEVPGPRVRGRGNWLVWYWLVMWLASITQLGGIVGSVGQALAISLPVTQMGRQYNVAADALVAETIERKTSTLAGAGAGDAVIRPVPTADQPAQQLMQQYTDRYGTRGPDGTRVARMPPDTAIWATAITVLTSLLLVVGRYRLIQRLSTAMVASFTALTVVNLFLLQRQETWRVTAENVLQGMSMGLPPVGDAASGGVNPIGTALATFGIIGVGASELVTYPYWCLERGYARFTGPYDGTESWTRRARGWMRVMRFDAWGSMVIYTFATIAFYLLGAAILYRVGLNPQKDDLVRTLAVMFVPVFSDWAAVVFLFGAFAVLYSTFFVANASHARVFSDALRVMGLIADDEATRQRWIRRLSGFFPVLCLLLFLWFEAPAAMVLLSGVTQGVMLPMLAAAALFFRYRRCLTGLCPGSLWDAALWISAAAMLITGLWTIYDQAAWYLGRH